MNQWDLLLGDEAMGALAADKDVSGRQLLLNPDMTTPSTQEVYASLARLATVTGLTWAEWYICNLASGNLTGVNSTVLTNGGGSFRFQSTWPGWDGTDMTSGFKALEFLGTAAATQGFAAADADVYNLTQSITVVICLRMLRPPAAARSLLGKKTSTAAATAGWGVYIAATGGVNLIVADGSTSTLVTASLNPTGPDGLTNGSPQWYAFKINPAGNAQILSQRTSGTASAVPGGTKTSADVFKFGGGAMGLNSPECCQVLCWGVLTGANAEAFTVTELNLLDNWCQTPDILAHYTRQNLIAPDVGTDATGVRVQHCAGNATYTTLTHFAHGWSANATQSTQGLGWVSHRATSSSSDTAATNLKKRNRLLQTNNLADASFTATNITATKNSGEDPSGFLGAAKLVATAAGGFVTQNFTGEINEVHSVSVYAQRAAGADVAARLSLYDSTGPTELAGTNITIGALRERFSLEVDDLLVGAVTTLQWRLTITNNTDQIYATFAQAEYGTLSVYQPQAASLVDRDDVEWYIDNTGNCVYDPQGGKVETTICGWGSYVPSTGCFIFTTNAGASNEDRHFIQRDALTSASPREARIYNGAGTLISQLDTIADVNHTLETTYTSEWSQRHPLPNTSSYHRAAVNSTTTVTGTVVSSAPWTAGTSADKVMPGMRHNYLAHIEGIIETLKIWGRL